MYYAVLYGIIRYYMVLYQKFSGLRRRYNTYSTNVTYETRAPLRGSVSYRPKSDSDPALLSIVWLVVAVEFGLVYFVHVCTYLT